MVGRAEAVREPEGLTQLGRGPSAGLGALAVHVVDLAALRRRSGSAALAAPHRGDAHALLLVTRGRGWHAVDFETQPCSAGTLLRVRPGQVQQFQVPGRLGGIQVRYTAELAPQAESEPESGPLGRLLDWHGGPVSLRLGSVDQAEIGGIVDSLAAEYAQPGEPHREELLGHLLLALLLRVDRLTAGRSVPTADAELFARFEAELERSFAATRRAADYAGLLGCNVRTLTRACQGAVGTPVRDVIDARVVLEAKRLLATTDEPLAALGHRLGFSDAAGLGRFFTRHAEVSASAFRRRYRAG